MNRALTILLCLALISGCTDSEPVESAEIDQEIAAAAERLRTLAREIDRGLLSERMADSLESDVGVLSSIEAIESPELSLYRLREPFVDIETLAYLAANREATESIESLEDLWGSRKGDFEFNHELRDGSLRSALLDVEEIRAERLFNASMQYGRISSPSSGLYYLAQAEGHRRFFEFLASLGSAEQESPLAKEALAIAADRVEAEALETFMGDSTSNEMIPVSVRLDEARELIERESLAGATLQILEARRLLSEGSGGESEQSDQAPYEPVRSDGGIHSLFAAMAEEDRTVARDVLPLLASMSAVGKETAGAGSREVKVTLVRWPYT